MTLVTCDLSKLPRSPCNPPSPGAGDSYTPTFHVVGDPSVPVPHTHLPPSSHSCRSRRAAPHCCPSPAGHPFPIPKEYVSPQRTAQGLALVVFTFVANLLCFFCCIFPQVFMPCRFAWTAPVGKQASTWSSMLAFRHELSAILNVSNGDGVPCRRAHLAL